MNTRPTDHTTFREWLYLEQDGELTAGERSSLKQHLGVCASCREEREELGKLAGLLATSKVGVGDGFSARVVSKLPPAGWEARSPRNWLVAVCIVALLVVSSVLLVGLGRAEAASALPVTALAAVGELLKTSALAGAGLLTASWKGLGLAMQDILGQSIWNTIALGVLVLCLNILLLRYLLRDRSVKVNARDSQDS